jgi:2-keto-4-pentenoate hydratase/2-oxohepta-3-ene-1,7-dioic acid hydratase in catechol pathway
LRIVRFSEGQSNPTYGVLEGEVIRGIKGDVWGEFEVGGTIARLEGVRLLAPCQPRKVVAVGLNYLDHAQETGNEVPQEPVIFMKPSTTVIGHMDDIIYPRMAGQVDYEAELAVVIRSGVRDVSPEQVKEHILGFTCANDVTARDLQRKDGQWTRSKSFDTFCPLGPCIATDVDASNLAVVARLNGQVRQKSSTRFLIFNVEHLVSFISRVMTLEPQDVVITGTPGGIGPMRPGDVVEIDVEGIGVLRNRVVGSGA